MSRTELELILLVAEWNLHYHFFMRSKIKVDRRSEMNLQLEKGGLREKPRNKLSERIKGILIRGKICWCHVNWVQEAITMRVPIHQECLFNLHWDSAVILHHHFITN